MGRLSRGILIGIITLQLTFAMPIAHASSDSIRSTKHFGFLINANGAPQPSVLGLNLAWNVVSFARLTGGVGWYNSGLNPTNWGVGLYNTIIVPIFYAFSYLFYGAFTGKKLLFSKFKNRVGMDYLPSKSVFTYGGDIRLMVPGLNTSPFAGVGYAFVDSKGHPWGVADKFQHTIISLGIDHTTPGGGTFAIGYGICKQIDNACGIFVNAGILF